MSLKSAVILGIDLLSVSFKTFPPLLQPPKRIFDTDAFDLLPIFDLGKVHRVPLLVPLLLRVPCPPSLRSVLAASTLAELPALPVAFVVAVPVLAA